MRKFFYRLLIVGVVLIVVTGVTYLGSTRFSSAVSSLINPAPPTAIGPIAFESYHHADDLELMFNHQYRVGSSAKHLRDRLKYSGATLEGKHIHATTTTYTYRKPVGTKTWMIWIDADSNGNILNISVDEA